MDNQELLTVAEYARLRKCSGQAVYKRLKTGLAAYTETRDGKTYLNRAKLEAAGLLPQLATVDNRNSTSWQPLAEVCNPENHVNTGNDPSKVANVCNPDSTNVGNVCNQNSTPGCQPLATNAPADSEALGAVLELLRQQLEAKDAEISRLHEEAAAARQAAAAAEEHNREMNVRLAELLTASQELQRNNQLLLAAAAKAEREREPIEAEPIAAEPEETQRATVAADREPERLPFWKRWFK